MVAVEAPALVAAAHHSSPKIIVMDQTRDPEEEKERPRAASVMNATATATAAVVVTGQDLLATTPYRGLDVQCEDEAVFFTEELRHEDASDDFSDLGGRRVPTPTVGLRTTLLLGGLAIAVLAVAVWVIERKPAVKQPRAASASSTTQPTAPPSRRLLTGKTTTPARKAVRPVAPRSEPSAVTPPSPTPEPAEAGDEVAAEEGAVPAPSNHAATVVTAGVMGSDTLSTAPVHRPSVGPGGASVPTASAPGSAPGRTAVAPASTSISTPTTTTRAVGTPAPAADRLAARASKLLTSNRAEAQKLAQAALAQNATHPLARQVLARIYEGQARSLLYSGANAAAVAKARRALRLDAGRANALFYLGVALHELRRRAEATRTLSRYLKRCPRCGYNSMFARGLVTANRRLAATRVPALARPTPPARTTVPARSTPAAPRPR